MMSKDESKSSNIFENYLYLKNVFNNDLTEILSEQDYNDHAIDLTKNQNISFISLYNLSQKKSVKFYCYLNNVLIKR